MKGNSLSDQDSASVSTRRGFINAVAAAGGTALLGRLGISLALAVEVTGRADRPLKAAFSNAGLQATWCAQGKRAAEYWGKVFNVDVTWFDGELSPTKQRKAIDNMATQKWDFVAIQALTEGTLTDPANKFVRNWSILTLAPTSLSNFCAIGARPYPRIGIHPDRKLAIGQAEKIYRDTQRADRNRSKLSLSFGEEESGVFNRLNTLGNFHRNDIYYPLPIYLAM